MRWSIDIKHSAETAERVLATLRDLGVPPTPQAYLIWYTHLSGGNPALSRLIRLLAADADEFSEQRCNELYERFFAAQDQARAVQGSSEAFEAIVERVGARMVATADDTAAYGAALTDVSSDLAEKVDARRLMALVGDLQGRTEAMQAHARELKAELERSGQEIETLRTDLANVRRAAYTDQLTGLGNRKLFDEVIRQQVAEVEEGGEPLALLIADIDHFKKFNDDHGHQVGDVVLRLVASKLRASLKGRDTVARYGGEEFAIILPRTAATAAAGLAEQLRKEIATSRIVLRKAERDLGVITLSIGVSVFQPGESVESFFERADRALYRAKHEGRNRVVYDDRTGHPSTANEQHQIEMVED